MRWVEVKVEATSASADAAANILIEEGCGGTATSSFSASLSDDVDVLGYLPVDDRLEDKLQRIKLRVRELPDLGLDLRSEDVTITWVEDKEWATAWKEFFKPLKIGRIVIKPTWEEYSPQPGDIIVEIDPGMAFGTGNHPTTKLCLLALQDYIKGGETVLDMGTGSAILAIAAAKLGATCVVGYDNDPVAVEAAQKNVQMQHLESTVTVAEADSPSAFDGTADMVLANIIPKVILAMAEELAAKVKPGGKLISSGIIQERADEVRDKLETLGLSTIEVRTEGDWVAIISKRR